MYFRKMSNLISVYTMLNGSIDRYFTYKIDWTLNFTFKINATEYL